MFGHDKPSVTPREFFLYVAGMALLYASAISLIVLLFQSINVLFPDPLRPYAASGAADGVRFAVAGLIIFFPLYVYMTYRINEHLRKEPGRKELGLRKWLLYLTLFVAGATVVVDLVVLLNTFLGGELTTRFLLKVVAILVIAGAVFGYYREDLRGRWEENKRLSRICGGIAGVVIIASIIGAFAIVGSPWTQRLVRFDERKVNDLRDIQWQVVNYWQNKGELPAELVDLQDPLGGFVLPSDPQTGAPYEYRMLSAQGNPSFELCAVFNISTTGEGTMVPPQSPESSAIRPRNPEDENWTHGEGHQCFTRTIDPELYPVREPNQPNPAAVKASALQ